MAKGKFPFTASPSNTKKATLGHKYDFSLDDNNFRSAKARIPAKKYSSKYTMGGYQLQKWLEEMQTIATGDESCPDDVLEWEDSEILLHWLAMFTTEIRKDDGSLYLPRALNLLLMGLQRHIRSTRPGKKINLLSETRNFTACRMCDSYLSQTTCNGNWD